MNKYKIGICGIGFVGSSMMNSFIEHKMILNENLFCYDKYKNIGSFEDLLNSDILFLALPTQFKTEDATYDLEPLRETLSNLNNYKGVIVLKSTLLPKTTNSLSIEYGLDLIHNPEFLTARTAFEDFHNQKHIVLGNSDNCLYEKIEQIYEFYNAYYPTAKISLCRSDESESMKLFANSFYAVKIQFFNELYLLCKKNNIEYDNVKDLMIENGWINKMHTDVPGPDGLLSYGGLCFPKDTNALLNFMKDSDVEHKVLESVVNERNNMRNDNDNVI